MKSDIIVCLVMDFYSHVIPSVSFQSWPWESPIHGQDVFTTT